MRRKEAKEVKTRDWICLEERTEVAFEAGGHEGGGCRVEGKSRGCSLSCGSGKQGLRAPGRISTGSDEGTSTIWIKPQCRTWIPIPAASSESEEERDPKLQESGQSQRATPGSHGPCSQTCVHTSKLCHQQTSLSLDSLVSL